MPKDIPSQSVPRNPPARFSRLVDSKIVASTSTAPLKIVEDLLSRSGNLGIKHTMYNLSVRLCTANTVHSTHEGLRGGESQESSSFGPRPEAGSLSWGIRAQSSLHLKCPVLQNCARAAAENGHPSRGTEVQQDSAWPLLSRMGGVHCREMLVLA